MLIDTLRGFALGGIILAHALSTYDYEFLLNDTLFTGSNALLKNLVDIFIVKKFYLVFSFLFGLSFYIQLNNAQQRGKPFIAKYIWRLGILFMIGLLNNIPYPFDILRVYALIGLLLLPIRNLSVPTLLTLAILLILSTGFVGQLPDILSYPSSFITRVVMVYALFILGLCAGKKAVFSPKRTNILLFKRLAIASVIFIVILKPTQSWIEHIAYLATLNTNLLILSLSFLYASLFVLLYHYLSALAFLWPYLASIGKMGLTNYLMLSIFFFLTYRCGLDFKHANGLAMIMSFSVLFFILQAFYSQWWLKKYKMGPLEWLWRMATDLKWHSNKLPPTANKQKNSTELAMGTS